MSNRPLFNKLMSNTMLRQLVMRQSPLVTRTQLQHSLKPRTPLNKPSMFSPTIIKRYWELSPLFIIVGGAVLGLFYAIVRNGLSRDDVRFYSSGKMNCEDVEKSGPRKFLVFNQKYKVPEGLKEALAAIEEPAEERTKKSK
ncbi:uncharacterized protein LOC126757802 isoform X1 [Bactrocera neohumeralis]|uniref:uncharacterized protein LOC126757802 isoform X1 n=1 Tax=Bactrocera neohumeralis TaxID=98809 RepID=UPI002165A696|nr:uncharacterized protein LOC126757802 isoform X1 [Bactrocera neohumeralis]XP_050327733.1 uncharacterized protein LOC126757802 isoform X1 [Bactrocera neohumeralis]XP_050327734.1 uncharacterized protein LOC126757802 isoform X1 [Bactrocera neohumeralis]XP_050327735.1 uncharacterized protein LOC126757802 isoform X1 [Bactrocera neohumeralis]